MSNKILVTGGAGFIGSALIRFLIQETDSIILNFDSLTYAGNLDALSSIENSERYNFCRGDICDTEIFNKILLDFRPNYVMHLAAESHVDNSISSPGNFISTNVIGTFSVLQSSREFYESLPSKEKVKFRFHHISTDEVYGDLPPGKLFTEETPYQPSSPYSASKAASDHLVRAWHRTYGLPTLITNCSNNYGPYQNSEKLIPTIINSALSGKPLPIYGDGSQIRDWLFVDDHVEALYKVILSRNIGQTFNIGGFNEMQNIEVVNIICDHLNNKILNKPKGIDDFKQLITFVEDRPGHDQRYAIDSSKIKKALNWSPKETFDTGIEKTIEWYINNQ